MPKELHQRQCPYYMRITVNGKRAEVTSGRDSEPLRWNARACRAIGSREEFKILNANIAKIRVTVTKGSTEFCLTRKCSSLPISVNMPIKAI